jgi:hypothetical protein
MDENKERLEEIKNSLTIEQVFDLLLSYGADPVLKDDLIICRTICHGGDSHKLYYYENTHLFRCYTECSDTFDIFQLVVKVESSGGRNYSLPQAINYVINFFNLSIENKNFQKNDDELIDWQIFNRYDKILNNENNKRTIEMKIYDDKILTYLPHPRILPWEDEGISKDVIKYHNICYNPSSQAIVIPHYNIDGELVGIRERTLIKENEIYGKYRPMYLNKQMYNHPLGFNLYNLNFSKENIKRTKKAIIFEGEKSPLLYASYFGQENDITVAVCGSSLSSYQVQLLLDLGIEEMIIAFDKQFQELGDKEHIGWVKKLKDINKKYSKYVRISYMFDKWGILGYKSSPIDEGKEKFLKLFDKRFSLE